MVTLWNDMRVGNPNPSPSLYPHNPNLNNLNLDNPITTTKSEANLKSNLIPNLNPLPYLAYGMPP
jgi:hypothetical protein